MALNLRLPVVAGSFYPADAGALKRQISSFLPEGAEPKDAIGCILPHAGYAYSGNVAVKTVSRIKIRERVILLGPNHTGRGKPFSLMRDSAWQTPLGVVESDAELSGALLDNSGLFEDDPFAHADEHSLEVELPILQYFSHNFKIVALVVSCADFKLLSQAGKDIADTVKKLNVRDSVMLVASSDMTHYEPEQEASRLDKMALDAILKLDEAKLFQLVKAVGITMCGYAPVCVMLSAAKALGAKKAELALYQTSGDVTGDKESVVGYAGLILY